MNRLPEPIKEKQFHKITPNSIHVITGKDKYVGYFFTYPKFAEALAFNLSPIAYFQTPGNRRWRLSPVGALGALCLAFLPKLGLPVALIGTTTDYYSAGGDGRIRSSVTAWSTVARGNGGSPTAESTSISFPVSIYNQDNENYRLDEVFLPIDTSALSSDILISDAFLYLKTRADINDLPYKEYLSVVQSSQASVETLSASDYPNLSYVDGSYGASSETSFNKPQNTYFTIELTSTGISWINKAGYTKLALLGQRHRVNLPSGMGTDYLYIFMSSSRDTGNEPYLRVTYEVSTTYSKILSSKARVKVVGTTKKESIKARIESIISKMTSAKSRIKNTATKKEQMRARIKNTKGAVASARAMIEKTPKAIVSGKARIFKTENKKATLKGRLFKIGSAQMTAKGRVVFTNLKKTSARARMKVKAEAKPSAKGRIKTTAMVKGSSRARMVIAKTGKAAVRAKVKSAGINRKISGKARMKKTGSQNLSGKASIQAKTNFKPVGK